MNQQEPLSDEQLLEAVLTGDISLDDERVRERCAAAEAFKEELESLLSLADVLEQDAALTRAAHEEASERPASLRAMPEAAPTDSTDSTAPTDSRDRLWWVPGLVAAAAIVMLLLPQEPDLPDFPGAGEFLGGEGLVVELTEPWSGTGLSYTLQDGPEEVSSLVEFLLDDGSTLSFPFDGTEWTPPEAQTQAIPVGATWRLSVYDTSGALIAIYPPPADD